MPGAAGVAGSANRADGTGGGPPAGIGGGGGGPPVIPPFPLPNLPVGISLVPQRVWSEHRMPDGKAYYYNKVTQQSMWDKPRDFELVMPLPSNLAPPAQGTGPVAAVARGTSVSGADQQVSLLRCLSYEQDLLLCSCPACLLLPCLPVQD